MSKTYNNYHSLKIVSSTFNLTLFDFKKLNFNEFEVFAITQMHKIIY